MFKVPEQYRVKTGVLASSVSDGNNGAFIIPFKTFLGLKSEFKVIASDGLGWQHVSVTVKGRKFAPTWDEMCFIKNLFWSENDTVIQFHPPKDKYVNTHPFCLHLWRSTEFEIEVPDPILIGFK